MARQTVDRDELRRVYREQVGPVYAFFAYSVSRAAAEDLTSATFERVVRSWSKYDPRRSSERTWILAIARNLLTDHYRRQRHRAAVSTDEHPVILDSLDGGEPPEEGVLSAEALRRWLAPLGERERMVLALRYAVDLSADETAELMGLTAANVHQITSRSLRKLRELGGKERRAPR